jgi:hypothetical protein
MSETSSTVRPFPQLSWREWLFLAGLFVILAAVADLAQGGHDNCRREASYLKDNLGRFITDTVGNPIRTIGRWDPLECPLTRGWTVTFWPDPDAWPYVGLDYAAKDISVGLPDWL